MSRVVAILTCIFLFVPNYHTTVPSYIHVCHKSDPDINRCILNSIEALRPALVKGIPELDVPPLEPLPLPTVSLSIGGRHDQPDTNVTDIKLWGPGDFKILEFKTKMSRHHFRFRVVVPKIDMEGQYEMNAKLLFLNLVGKGPITINVTRYEFECVLTGNRKFISSKEYLIFNPLQCTFDVGSASVHLADLFSGDPLLGNATNAVINDNVRIFLDEVKPVILKALIDMFTDIANKITKRFEYSELFPE